MMTPIASVTEGKTGPPSGPWSDRLVLVEASLCLSVAAVCIRTLPFRWVGAVLRRRRDIDSPIDMLEQERQARRVRWAISSAVRKGPIRYACLAQSVAGKIMLSRRNTPSSLRLGVRKEGDGRFAAHAWLLAGDTFVTGRGGHKQFTPVARFD